MTYIYDIHDITYMTCVYAGTRYPSIYVYGTLYEYRTLPPTGAHYFKRYKKNINLYYLPLFIDKKPCPSNYFCRFQY